MRMPGERGVIERLKASVVLFILAGIGYGFYRLWLWMFG